MARRRPQSTVLELVAGTFWQRYEAPRGWQIVPKTVGLDTVCFLTQTIFSLFKMHSNDQASFRSVSPMTEAGLNVF